MILNSLKYKLLVFFILMLSNVFSQHEDIKKVLNKITDYYESNENFQMQTTYRVHRGDLSGELLEIQQGVYRQYKTDEYSYTLGEHKMIQNKEHYFVIDHGMNRMIITQYKSDEEKNAVMLSFDESLKLCSAVIHEGNKITFKYDNASAAGYKKVELEYNPKTYAIKRIVLHPNQKHYHEISESEYKRIDVAMEIRYGEIQKNKVTKEELKIIGVYLQKKGKELQVSQKYNNYQLINQT